jgi:hypothetical protein
VPDRGVAVTVVAEAAAVMVGRERRCRHGECDDDDAERRPNRSLHVFSPGRTTPVKRGQSL